MKNVTLVIMLIVLAGVVAFGGEMKSSKEKKAPETTIKGEVVDVSCYLRHGKDGMGDGHKECGEACAKNGGPLGILTKDGKLFVSVLPDDHKNGPNFMLMDHVSHMVEVTGVVRSKGGTNGIMISKVTMADNKEGGEQKN